MYTLKLLINQNERVYSKDIAKYGICYLDRHCKTKMSKSGTYRPYLAWAAASCQLKTTVLSSLYWCCTVVTPQLLSMWAS